MDTLNQTRPYRGSSWPKNAELNELFRRSRIYCPDGSVQITPTPNGWAVQAATRAAVTGTFAWGEDGTTGVYTFRVRGNTTGYDLAAEDSAVSISVPDDNLTPEALLYGLPVALHWYTIAPNTQATSDTFSWRGQCRVVALLEGSYPTMTVVPSVPPNDGNGGLAVSQSRLFQQVAFVRFGLGALSVEHIMSGVQSPWQYANSDTSQTVGLYWEYAPTLLKTVVSLRAQNTAGASIAVSKDVPASNSSPLFLGTVGSTYSLSLVQPAPPWRLIAQHVTTDAAGRLVGIAPYFATLWPCLPAVDGHTGSVGIPGGNTLTFTRGILTAVT